MGEGLLNAMFRLIPLLALHQLNNTLVVSHIAAFKEHFKVLGQTMGGVNISIYRGRLFFNEDRMVASDTLAAIAPRMIDFLITRKIHGFRFIYKDDISDSDVALVARAIDQSNQQEDPVKWLKTYLAEQGIGWFEPIAEGEFKKPGRESFNEIADMTYSKAMVALAKKTYGRALGSLMDIGSKISQGQRIAVQRPKRVIQEMIEMLSKDDTILLAMSTIRDYDDYTYTHSVNVAILSMCLGKRLNLPRGFIEQLGLCGLFHDLGKVELPIGLINKKERLTDDEFELIKEHSMNSVRQIIRLNADHALKSKLLLAPFEHHLGVDLAGYPRTGRQAPLSLLGRILTIADVYDAMTSGRVYRPEGIKPDQALKLMVEEAGTKLDPLILKTFVDMIGIYPVGSLVVMDSQEVGLVMETPGGCEIGRPRVRLLALNEEGQPLKGDYVELSERDDDGEYLRTIIRCLNPSDYGIQPTTLMG